MIKKVRSETSNTGHDHQYIFIGAERVYLTFSGCFIDAVTKLLNWRDVAVGYHSEVWVKKRDGFM